MIVFWIYTIPIIYLLYFKIFFLHISIVTYCVLLFSK